MREPTLRNIYEESDRDDVPGTLTRSYSDSETIRESGGLLLNETTPLLHRRMSESDLSTIDYFSHLRGTSRWLPGDYRGHRSIKRSIFLLLTEPSSSVASLVFFTILIVLIALSNIIMILQTMDPWQFTPSDCVTCGGNTQYMFEDDDSAAIDSLLPNCICPPAPKQYTVRFQDFLIYFFSIEWIFRVICYEPPYQERAASFWGHMRQVMGYLGETTTILDFLAIYPYYLERYSTSTKGLLSLRLLRLFRVFQLLRLGQFNETFLNLLEVMGKSLLYLRILAIVLIFASAFFGSMLYWLEKGEWKYWTETGEFRFVRVGTDGVTLELSPFTNIPQSFWWFLVTATTVGYGDMYPTSGGGKLVAIFAMLTGVLVIAFPVSVFSSLWQEQLHKEGINSKENGGQDDQTNTLISKDDAKAIMEHITAVEKHQEKIRQILEKYSVDIKES